jgi:SRSO17 transposase
VGVQRQYTGTAGRIKNSQVAVHLVYAGARRHAAVDRELYVPRSWTGDPDRCRAAGLNEGAVFATEPELAGRMIDRFLNTGHRVGWVAGDEVYGGNPQLRDMREAREELGELLIRQGRAGEALAVLPTVAEHRAANAESATAIGANGPTSNPHADLRADGGCGI